MSDAAPNKINYHKSIFIVLAQLRTPSRIKRYLKSLGCTGSEQDEIFRAFKKERGIS
jgi:hypothetical protein